MLDIIFLCLKIFFCMVLNVSMSTYRTVIMVKGKLMLSTIVAIFECLIWFLVVREAISFDADSTLALLAIGFSYSIGSATGTFVGSAVAKKMEGLVQVQIITSNKDDSVIEKIQDAGYALTVVKSEKTKFSGEKYMIFAEIKNSKTNDFKKLVNALDEKAFIMINDTKYVYNGFIKG